MAETVREPRTARVHTFADEEDDEEEEEDLLDDDSGCMCAECSAFISMTEEVFLLRAVVANVQHSELQLVDLLTQDGDYMYSPQFYCFDCFESVLEDLQEQVEDIPPLLDAEGRIECDACKSDIRSGEVIAVAQFGEIHWSDRSPNGVGTATFVEMGTERHLCPVCIKRLEDAKSEPVWGGDVAPVPGVSVCQEGLFIRCWRNGACPSNCDGNCDLLRNNDNDDE